jgi:hypothetical protein
VQQSIEKTAEERARDITITTAHRVGHAAELLDTGRYSVAEWRPRRIRNEHFPIG